MYLEEVMSEFGVERGAIINWRKTRGFPEPISKNPMRFLRSAIEEWKEHTGGVKAPN